MAPGAAGGRRQAELHAAAVVLHLLVEVSEHAGRTEDVNAQGLLSMLKLIMTCEDPNLKLTMSSSPSGIHHDRVISH